MKHKNPGASNIFLIRIQTERKQKRFGTPKSSEAKRPTINIGERGGPHKKP